MQIVATPEATALHDVLETRRILSEVLTVTSNRLSYVLNRPHPYTGVTVSEFSAATASPWVEIGHGGDVPATASLRGESLLDSRGNNAVIRGVMRLADDISAQAREQAALSGRS